ncbi:MAG: VWA domain-containing protein [Thermoanaerobaculia bacterium]
MRAGASLFAFALSLVVAPVFGQKAQDVPPLVERVEVSVINVDAIVTDGQGRPVMSLTPDDFEILEDGKPQKITGFYKIQHGIVSVPDGSSADQVADQFRRKAILMFDNNSLDTRTRNAAIERVKDFIDNQFSEKYEWAVINVGPTVGTIQPFTDRRGEIDAALARVRHSPTFGSQRAIDRRLLSDTARNELRGQEFDSNSFNSGYDFGATARFQSREQTMRNLRATMTSAKAVIETCRAYSASSGKKILVLVTGGLELNTDFAQYSDDRGDRNMIEMKREMQEVFDAMVKEANAANFSIYVINAAGHQNVAPQHDVTNASAGTGGILGNPRDDTFNKFPDVSDPDSAGLTLAEGTGGRYLPSNSVSESIRTIDDESANFYSLAYSPSHQGDGRYHKIEVRVKQPHLNVRNREGYVDLSDEQRLEQSLRSPITFAKEKGTLDVKIKLGTPERNHDKRLVPITASMPVTDITFVPKDAQEVGRVHVYLAIYDEKGDNVGFAHQIQDVSILEKNMEQTAKGSFKYTMKVALPKGNFTLVVTLRDDVSNEIGTAYENVRL